MLSRRAAGKVAEVADEVGLVGVAARSRCLRASESLRRIGGVKYP